MTGYDLKLKVKLFPTIPTLVLVSKLNIIKTV